MSSADPAKPKQAGMFLGLNPKGWGPLTLQPCQCKTCAVIRACNELKALSRVEVETP